MNPALQRSVAWPNILLFIVSNCWVNYHKWGVNVRLAMKIIFQVCTALALISTAMSAPVFAQNQEKPPAKDETKMDAKGVPGSPDTQSGQAPTSGESTAPQSSGASGGPPSSGQMGERSQDATKMDPKGVEGSPGTQSGEKPGTK
jgi:hypothetical protein